MRTKSLLWRMQMKSIRKILFVMAALAAVFGFVACSNDDDEPSTVAVYERKSTWKEGDVECYDISTVTVNYFFIIFPTFCAFLPKKIAP